MKFKKLFLIILLILIIGLILVGIILLDKSIVPTNKESTITSKEDGNIENGASISNDDEPKDIIVIEEKMFMNQLNDIYMKYDGFVHNDEFTKAVIMGREYYCCGYDSYMVGFECNLKDGQKPVLENDKWFNIEGVIYIKEGENNMEYPCVKITNLQEIQEGERIVAF